jgi:molybdenum cofactor cytidylyltransferase
LPATIGGTVFLLTTQPQVPPALIRALTEAHSFGLFPVVAPTVGAMRAHPVLFDRTTFPELSAVTGTLGSGSVIERILAAPGGLETVHLVPWPDDRLLLDVDTPEDCRRLMER